MQSSSDFLAKHHRGWETSSDEYLAHVRTMERATSVSPDLPHYPNVHMIFNKKVTYEEEQESRTKPRAPEARKKVQFVEPEKTTEYSDRNGNFKVVEESFTKTDAFIQQKHKKFELCKWATFKGL